MVHCTSRISHQGRQYQRRRLANDSREYQTLMSPPPLQHERHEHHRVRRQRRVAREEALMDVHVQVAAMHGARVVRHVRVRVGARRFVEVADRLADADDFWSI